MSIILANENAFMVYKKSKQILFPPIKIENEKVYKEPGVLAAWFSIHTTQKHNKMATTTFNTFSSNSVLLNLSISLYLSKDTFTNILSALLALSAIILLTYGARIIKPIYRVSGFAIFFISSFLISYTIIPVLSESVFGRNLFTDLVKTYVSLIIGVLAGLVGIYLGIILLKAIVFAFYVIILTGYSIFLGYICDTICNFSSPIFFILFSVIGFIVGLYLGARALKDKIEFKRTTIIMTSLQGAFIMSLAIYVADPKNIIIYSFVPNLCLLFGILFQRHVSCKGFDIVNPLNDEVMGDKEPILPKSIKSPIFGSI